MNSTVPFSCRCRFSHCLQVQGAYAQGMAPGWVPRHACSKKVGACSFCLCHIHQHAQLRPSSSRSICLQRCLRAARSHPRLARLAGVGGLGSVNHPSSSMLATRSAALLGSRLCACCRRETQGGRGSTRAIGLRVDGQMSMQGQARPALPSRWLARHELGLRVDQDSPCGPSHVASCLQDARRGRHQTAVQIRHCTGSRLQPWSWVQLLPCCCCALVSPVAAATVVAAEAAPAAAEAAAPAASFCAQVVTAAAPQSRPPPGAPKLHCMQSCRASASQTQPTCASAAAFLRRQPR